MSFLSKHTEVLSQMQHSLSGMNVYGSENEMYLSDFPAIGFFLGTPVLTQETNTYHEIEYDYILSAMDLYDRDDPDAQLAVLSSTYNDLVSVIKTMGFDVVINPEQMLSIEFGGGSFITGWTTVVRFNA